MRVSREVVYIQWMTGDRDGEFWILTLDCGHVVTRVKRTPVPADIVRPEIWKRFSAPRRVGCHYCEAGEPQRPVVLPVER